MKKRTLIYIACIALLGACSTQYKPEGMMQTGYTEFRTANNKFVVSFRGNSLTSSDRVMKYALLRASEVTLANDFLYFKVEEKEDISKIKIIKTTEELPKDKSIEHEITRRSEMVEEKAPGVRLYIKCYKENPKHFDGIDAKEYLKYNKKH